MAGCGRKVGFAMASNLMRTLTRTGFSSKFPSNSRSLSGGFASSEIITSHTDKWMQTAILHSGIQLSSFALTLISQLSANIVVYVMFKTMATITTKSRNKLCKQDPL
ncbi:hypothetical protein RHMOL_Rhmol09G0274700 [Rhododendron molle]|uniref:Uncharacterized protein n=1 Tax=Rhododendron molle TaxID=49168 RepID=A0ACC0MII5_RHOML|nr:hypothetical protein RHMOL_Rhmol09G0274700 [Rhododendron molle]